MYCIILTLLTYHECFVNVCRENMRNKHLAVAKILTQELQPKNLVLTQESGPPRNVAPDPTQE
jgi:hypothetical protein